MDRETVKSSALSSKYLLEKVEYLTCQDLGHKPSVFEKVKFEYTPLGMTFNEVIKPADNAYKPVKYNSGLRYGSYSFVEFKHDAEKLKKTPSLDSKNKEMKRLLENLNKFKKSPLRKSENKKGKDFVKKNVEDVYHNRYYDVYKKQYNKEKNKLSAANKKKV